MDLEVSFGCGVTIIAGQRRWKAAGNVYFMETAFRLYKLCWVFLFLRNQHYMNWQFKVVIVHFAISMWIIITILIIHTYVYICYSLMK